MAVGVAWTVGRAMLATWNILLDPYRSSLTEGIPFVWPPRFTFSLLWIFGWGLGMGPHKILRDHALSYVLVINLKNGLLFFNYGTRHFNRITFLRKLGIIESDF